MSFEIRPSHVNFWTGHLALINRALELQVRVWLDASRGTNRGQTARQIQSPKTCGVLGIQRRRTARCGVIHVVVHADESRDHRVALQVEHLCALRNFRACGVSHRGDFSIRDNQCLIRARNCAGSIDHANVRQRHNGRVFLHKDAHFGRKLWRRLRPAKRRQ